MPPGHFLLPFDWKLDTPERQARFEIRKRRWKKHCAAYWQRCGRFKLREVNTVKQECQNRDGKHLPGGWINDESARHLTANEVYDRLTSCRATGANMLLNIGPRRDGSIHPDDWKTLTEVGPMIRTRGWPKEGPHALGGSL